MVVDRIKDIVVQFDPNGLIEFISPSVRQLGYEPEDLIGRHMAALGHPEETAENDRRIEERLAGVPLAAGQRNRFRVRRADGEWLWFESSPSMIQGEAGKIIAVVATLRLCRRPWRSPRSASSATH